MGDVLLTAVGVVLVVVALRDVFHTLWQPSGEGALSRMVSVTIWRVARRGGPRVRGVTGPLVLVSVILVWTALLIVGWALVYWPHLGDGFSYDTGLEPAERGSFVDALYLSTVVLGTLGFGDIVPTVGWLRIVTAGEALVGFSLLTASVSWVIQIQPALTHRRSLAAHLAALRTSDVGLGHGVGPTSLEALARDVTTVHVQLSQAFHTYYFRDRDRSSALAAQLLLADTLSAPRPDDTPQVRLGRHLLDVALERLGEVLDRRFVPGGGPREDVFARYALDQGHPPG